MTQKKSSHPLLWRVLLILAAICVVGVVIGLYGRTIMEPYVLTGACGLLGVVTASLFERRKSAEGWSAWRIARMSFTFVFSSMLFAAVFLGVNVLFPDKESQTEVKAVVSKVYSETRHRSRRVGRRYVPTGEEYKVYYMDIKFPGGCVKPRQINFSRFRTTHPGDTITVRLENGFLGIPFVSAPKKAEK